VKNIKQLTQFKQVSLKTKAVIVTIIMGIALVSAVGINNVNYNSSTNSPNKYMKVFGSEVKQPVLVYKTQYGVTTSSVSIRTGASTAYSVQGTFANKTNVIILATSGSFYKVSYSGITGYVSNQYVKLTAKPVAVAPVPKKLTFEGYIQDEDCFIGYAPDFGSDTRGCLLMHACANSGYGITALQSNSTFKYYYFDGKFSTFADKKTFDGTGSQLSSWKLINATKKKNHVTIKVTGTLNGDTKISPYDGIKYPVITVTALEEVAPSTILNSIAITKPATKLTYTVGSKLDITGLNVTGTYIDKSKAVLPISVASVTGFNSSKPVIGEVLTVTVGGKATTYKINVKPVLSSITITKPATKLTYEVGNKLDITGLNVTGTYSDKSKAVLPITAANVTGFNSSKPVIGQILTVTVGGKSTTYTININSAVQTITGFVEDVHCFFAYADPATDTKGCNSMHSCAKTGYGITVPQSDGTKKFYFFDGNFATFADGITFDGTSSQLEAWNLIQNTTKKNNITINITGTFDSTEKTYVDGSGISHSFQVLKVSSLSETSTLTSIGVTTPATKLTYTVGDKLDITGLQVTGTYEDKTTTLQAVSAANITGFDSSIPTTGQVVTVTVGGKTTTYIIDVKPTPSSIAITTAATKLAYTVGEKLNITGLQVTATYDNNSTAVLPITATNVTGFDSSKPVVGQILTITVGGKTITYTIDINRSLSGIAVTTAASKLTYTVGDILDIIGLQVTGTYSDSSTAILPITVANVTGFDSSKSATSQTLTITYGGKTATYTINIVDPVQKVLTFEGYIQDEDCFIGYAPDFGSDTKGCLLMHSCANSGYGITALESNGTFKYYYFDGKFSTFADKKTFDGTGSQLASWNLATATTKKNHVTVKVTGTLNGETKVSPYDGISYPVITVTSLEEIPSNLIP